MVCTMLGGLGVIYNIHTAILTHSVLLLTCVQFNIAMT